MRPTFLPVLLFLAAGACSHVTVPVNPGTLMPSDLNSSPDRYDGVTVFVYGFMQAEFESYKLLDSKQALVSGELKSQCVSLLIPRKMTTDRFHDRYVVVRARFAKQRPPRVIQLGGCNTTTELELLEPPTLAPEPISSGPNNSCMDSLCK
jgi:hypothetical protein